jgi:uncharacterized protein YdiU (UPF0061 family)
MITRAIVEDALLDGFKDALKTRYETIAANAIGASSPQAADHLIVTEFANALKNLMNAYSDCIKELDAVFPQ